MSWRRRSVGWRAGQWQTGRRQAGSGIARSRARALLNWVSQGQRWGRCKVRRRAVQRRLTDAAGGTIRLPVGANVRCSGAHRLRTSRPANCRVTTPVSGERRLTDAAGGTIRLPVGANVRCSGAHRLRTSRPANCRVTTPVSGEVSQMVESRSMVRGPSSGPAPAAQARASSSRLTRSSWRTWPHRKLRRNVPRVDGALTRQPMALAVPPVRSTSASSMQSHQPARRPPGSAS